MTRMRPTSPVDLHVSAAVGLLVEADDVDHANLGHRLGDHRDLGADQVFVHHSGRAGQERDFDRPVRGQLVVDELLDSGTESFGQRIELEVHARAQRLHVAAGHGHPPLVPDHAAQHVQRGVRSHQLVPTRPLDDTVNTCRRRRQSGRPQPCATRGRPPPCGRRRLRVRRACRRRAADRHRSDRTPSGRVRLRPSRTSTTTASNSRRYASRRYNNSVMTVPLASQVDDVVPLRIADRHHAETVGLLQQVERPEPIGVLTQVGEREHRGKPLDESNVAAHPTRLGRSATLRRSSGSPDRTGSDRDTTRRRSRRCRQCRAPCSCCGRRRTARPACICSIQLRAR